MKLKMYKELKRLDLIARGNELLRVLGMDIKDGKRITERPKSEEFLVATIENPVLMRDDYAICQLPVKERIAIFSLYGYDPRVTEYDGVEVEFYQNQYPSVWGPSIDTIFFLDKMRKDGDIFTEEVKSAAELCAGSGFIGKYTIDKCDNIEKLYLVDINPKAMEFAQKDVTEKYPEKQMVITLVRDARNMSNEKVDLLELNPPYVPRPQSANDSPYEGVDLLHDIIVKGKKFLNPSGKLVLNYSSLSEKIVEKSLDEAKKYYGLKDVKELGQMKVPLKVPSILWNDEWIKYLRGNHDFLPTPHEGYEYWHDIHLIQLTYD